ncbi:LLM class oxidoreductase [Flindersiella endophytica]
MTPVRPSLGRLGIWTFAFDGLPHGRLTETAAELDELGYGTIWFGEAFGRDALTQAAFLLAATRRTVVATGIANIFLRTAFSLAAAERSLAEAYPGRFVLGLGGHRTRTQPVSPGFEHLARPGSKGPLTDMRAYLDAMDSAALQGVAPAPASPSPRVLAALGPKLLDLAASRTWGAHPYFVPVEHTARARAQLGAGPLLAVEQAVVLSSDPTEVREVARQHVGGYLGLAEHQTNNLRRLGFGDADLTAGGSDRLVDAIVAGGDLGAIVKRVREHLDAGADHVCVQVLTTDPGRVPLAEWREIATIQGELA